MMKESISHKAIFRILAVLLHIPGIMAIISLVIPLIFHENYAYVPLIITAAVSFISGQILYHLTKGDYDSNVSHSLMGTALAWIMVPVVGALPIYLIANQFPAGDVIPKTVMDFRLFLNSFFEAQSGFTSTGLTMAADPSQLPHTIQWWRSFMEWIGGAGMILFIISAFNLDVNEYNVYYAEGREDKIANTIQDTAKVIWWIYLGYTILAFTLFVVFGMPVWEAVNHSLTGISTGGFSITSNSIGGYTYDIKLVVALVMILGAISFPTHSAILRNFQPSALWKHQQSKYLLILIALGTIVIVFLNWISESNPFWVDSFFQWASALGTCGFSTVKEQDWSIGTQLILAFGMIIGGAAGSTTGGIKISRFIIFTKWIKRNIAWVSKDPEQFKIADTEGDQQRTVDRSFIAAGILTFMWLSLILIGTFILIYILPDKFTLSNIFFETSSALGSVGLSTGITGPEMPDAGKIIFILYMWLGRLEVIPIIILISGLFKGIRSIFVK